MRNIFLSFILVLFSFSWALGQKKDTVPTMIPKRITQKAPEPVAKTKEAVVADSIASIPKKDSISYGFHIGIQVSNLLSNDRGSFGDLAFKSTSKKGINFGFYIDIPIAHNLFLQPEINYSEKGYNAETGILATGTAGKYRRTYNDIEIPLQIKYYAGKKLFFTLGGAAAYNFQVNDYYSVASTVNNYAVYTRQLRNLRKIEPSILFGIGIKTGERISFAFNYSFDLLSNYSFIGEDAPKFRNTYFNLRLGYRLSKNAGLNTKK